MLSKRRTKVEGAPVVRVVSDAGIATPSVADGKLMPVLTLNSKDVPELTTMLDFHQNTPPGDVTSTWLVQRFSKSYMYLLLEFVKPTEMKVAIEFKLSKHPPVIDGIIISHGFYLRTNDTSDHFADDLESPCIIVEVPDETIPPYWEELYRKLTLKKIKKAGYSKKEAQELSKEHISRMREKWGRTIT